MATFSVTWQSHDHYAGACDLYTWGSGHRGMLGHKDEDDEKCPRVVESLLGKDIIMAACGVAHTMAVGGGHRKLS